MLGYIEYLGFPLSIGIGIIILYFVMNLIGELLEFKGKVVPEFLKIRKYFKRKKEERDTLQKLPSLMQEVTSLLNNVEQHYSADNIGKRDGWMSNVDQQLTDTKTWRDTLDKKLDKTNGLVLSILIENKRSEIISFASYVVESKNPVTHEQFNRIFKTYDEYETLLSDNNMTNGEADVAIRIIREAYEDHLKGHTFIENIRFGMD